MAGRSASGCGCNKEQPIEEEVYLGDMPIMIGGGEFIINGAERVVVSQLHRRPASTSSSKCEAGERKLHSCRIIPERGSWIEINITKKDTLSVRIDQSGKFSAMTLLRAMDPKYSTDADDPAHFLRPTKSRRSSTAAASRKIEGKIAVGDVVYPVGSDRGRRDHRRERPEDSPRTTPTTICARGAQGRRDHRRTPNDAADLATRSGEDPTNSHEEALLRIYQRLRPGNPPQLEKAKELFHEKFYDTNRYRLGRVGRFRINRKFKPGRARNEMTLRADDLINAIKYLLRPAPATRRPRRRHRSPGQSPSAHDRRTGLRRTAQGLLEAPPHRAGAHEPQGSSRT